MCALLLVIDRLANAFQDSCLNEPHISGKHHSVSILDQSFSSNCLTSIYSLLHQSRLCIFVLMLSVLSIFPSSPCLLSTNIFSLVVFYDHGCAAQDWICALVDFTVHHRSSYNAKFNWSFRWTVRVNNGSPVVNVTLLIFNFSVKTV